MKSGFIKDGDTWRGNAAACVRLFENNPRLYKNTELLQVTDADEEIQLYPSKTASL